jgi:CrcB protein
MYKVLLIGFGGFLGTIVRYWISGLVSDRTGTLYPWGTFTVNFTGSFVIGVLAGLTFVEGRTLMSPLTRDFLVIGILGGYTTFSSFSLQTLNLMREHNWLYGGSYILLSVAGCLIAVWLGHLSGKSI